MAVTSMPWRGAALRQRGAAIAGRICPPFGQTPLGPMMIHRSRRARTRPDRFASALPPLLRRNGRRLRRSDAAQAIAHALAAGQEFPFMRA